jgi:hypothetical protein
MLITTLHVNLTSYVLHPEVEPNALATDIEGAARSGGAFVSVRTSDGVDRSVLITPGLLVEIEPLDTGSTSACDGEDLFGDHDETSTFGGLELYAPPRPSYFQW